MILFFSFIFIHMLYSIIIGTIIIIDIILVGCIINNTLKNQIEIYIYFLTININLILLCLFIMKNNKKKNEKRNELLSVIDNNDNITIIYDKIDEFINKYSLYQDRVSLIHNLRYELIINKRKELYRNLRLKLKNSNEITEEIVREELIILRNNLDEYKEILEIKINSLLELHNIKIVIINISS